MRILSSKKISTEDEIIAKKLHLLCIEPNNCKKLFSDTLIKLEINERDLQTRNILNASHETITKDNSSALAKPTNRFNKLKLYMPMAALMILLLGGIFIGNRGFQNNTTQSIINQSENKPNGTVTSAVSSLNSEITSELELENQLQSETQASVEDIFNSAKSFGEISNENTI